MKYLYKIIYLLFFPTLLSAQADIYKQVAINTSTPEVLEQLTAIGIGLRCGVSFDESGRLLLQLSESELTAIQQVNIDYQIVIDNLNATVRESEATLALARQDLKRDKNRPSNPDFSMGDLVSKNYTQSTDCLEENIVTPNNFNLTTTNYMNGNLTYTEMLTELDDMRQYSLNNGLSIVSVKTPLSASRTTYENRPIYYVRISDNADTDEAGEPETLLTAMHHAREPVGMMNTIFTMWYIIENYGTDPFITNLVNHHELYFVPCVNPDGFQTNVDDRANGGAGFWRKNRQVYGGCVGVDNNRNYCDTWGLGASSNCNSSTYRGPSCLSEQENLSIQDFILAHDIKAAINCHTAIPSLFHPYSNGDAPPPNINQLSRWAHDMTRYNRFLYGDGELEGGFSTIGGESDDWMFNTYDIYAFTPELSRSGSFYPPSTHVLPDCKEFLRANLTLMAYSGVYAHLHDLNPLHLNQLTGNLEFGIERLGASDGNFTLTVMPVSTNIQSVSNNVKIFNNPTILDIDNNRQVIAYTLNPDIQNFEAITFQVTLHNGAYEVFSKTITKYYQATILAEDNFDSGFGAGKWSNTGWSTSVNDVFRGGGAVTTGAYVGSDTRTLEWTTPIDLSDLTTAELFFYAHWDIEKIWDYVAVEARETGGTWTRLCTNFSKPGSPNNVGLNNLGDSNQPTDEPIIDGKQIDWVLVKSDLSAFVGSSTPITFRLRMITDGSGDGTTNNGNGAGMVIDELVLSGIGTVALALANVDFTATLNDGQTVDLAWSVITMDIENIDIQRSSNSVDWASIHHINSSLTESVFNYRDEYPLSAKNYYRLKITGTDGKVDYSPIRMVDVEATALIDVRFPYPRTLELYSAIENSFSYFIFNTTGQLVTSEDMVSFKGQKRIDLGHLARGVYMVQVISNERKEVKGHKFFLF